MVACKIILIYKIKKIKKIGSFFLFLYSFFWGGGGVVYFGLLLSVGGWGGCFSVYFSQWGVGGVVFWFIVLALKYVSTVCYHV